MKKLIPILIVVATVLAGGFFYVRNRPEGARVAGVRAAQLAPAETAIYLELPDVGRMAERWEGTALREMVQDWGSTAGPPGAWVLAALGCPEWGEVLALWKQADPVTVFFARSDPSGKEPVYVAGFSYRGTKTAVKAAIERGRKVMLGGWSNVKSELILFEGLEIESVTSASAQMALAHRDNWFLVAGSVEQMKALLRRYDRASGAAGGLAGDVKFAECWKEATPDADFYAYVNSTELHRSLDREVDLAPQTTLSMRIDTRRTGEEPEAVLYSMKMEGREMRGRMFFRMPHAPREESRADRLDWWNMYRASELKSSSTAKWQAWDDWIVSGVYQSEITSWMARAMKSGEAATVFGPHVWMHWTGAEWWGDGTHLADGKRGFLALEVREPAKARKTAEAMAKVLTHREVPGRGGLKEEESEAEPGITYWKPDSPDDPSRVLVGLSATHLIAGDHLAVFVSGFSLTGAPPWWKTVQEVQTGPEFQTLRRRLPGEAMALGSADVRAMARSVFVRLGFALKREGQKEAADYFEEAKFPATAWFSKPPGPQAAVYLLTGNGYVVESLGPFPLEETLLPAALLFLFGKGK